MTKHTQLSQLIGIAICNAQIALTTGTLQLFPEGQFDAPQGSMLGLKGPWYIDESLAAAAIQRIQQLENDIVIDYEHQTLRSAENGKPAPAAGWIKRNNIKWVAGKGLVAENVEWTAEAKAYIESGQYKYLSPVFAFSKSSGNVLDVRQAALTNYPAIDGMDAVVAAATAKFLPNQPEDTSMDEELLELLGLKKDASVKEVIAACTAMNTKITTLESQLASKDEEIAAASAATPESAVTVITELQSTVAALTARLDGNDMDTLIAAAKADGKLTPAMESWARELGVEQFKKFISAAPQIAALTQDQTTGKQFDENGKAVLSENQLAVCSQLGLDPAEYAKQLEEAH